jgi:hypothetical protein
MRQLNPIQKRERLNDVYATDEIGPGGANHVYHIFRQGETPDENFDNALGVVILQKGPRKDESSTQGTIDSDLLEIVRDRLIAFQAGDFACRTNAIALTKIEEALMWLNRRVDDRIDRNVLGTMEK